MGYRLHVARVYHVEYALGSDFNYKCEEFHELLSALGAEYTGDSWDPDFEVSRRDWTRAVEKLKSLDNLEDHDERDGIMKCIENLDSTTGEVIGRMGYFLENSDPDSDYLHLSFF